MLPGDLAGGHTCVTDSKFEGICRSESIPEKACQNSAQVRISDEICLERQIQTLKVPEDGQTFATDYIIRCRRHGQAPDMVDMVW